MTPAPLAHRSKQHYPRRPLESLSSLKSLSLMFEINDESIGRFFIHNSPPSPVKPSQSVALSYLSKSEVQGSGFDVGCWALDGRVSRRHFCAQFSAFCHSIVVAITAARRSA